MTTRRCSSCRQEKPVIDFANDHRKPLGYGYRCKSCEAERHAAYEARKDVLERRALFQRRKYWRDPQAGAARRARYRATHDEISAIDRDPFKEAARRELREAVRSGRAIKPSICEDCGAGNTVIHGHHEDYSRALDVAWLCRICHGRRHRKYEDPRHVSTR